MGWLGLAAYVAGYDLFALASGRPTLSADYLAALRAHPALVLAASAYIAAHLTRVMPRRLDVLDRLFGAAGGVRWR